MNPEPWQYYFDVFRTRAARIPDDAFGRNEMLYEAAHDAYQQTTNHLTGSGWDEEKALTVTRLFGQVVKDWLARGRTDLEQLRAQLSRHYSEWRT